MGEGKEGEVWRENKDRRGRGKGIRDDRMKWGGRGKVERNRKEEGIKNEMGSGRKMREGKGIRIR